MFTTPRKGGGAYSTVESPHKVIPLRGYFVDGIWHCNCSPRLPAVFFKVKKEGRNKGRGFWTCQQPKDSDNGCGFFLWEEDAIKREMRAVISNSRSEPASAMKNNTPRPKANDGQPMARTNSGDDEFGAWPLTQQDEDEVIFVAEKKTTPYPETPRKSIKTSAFATPGTKRKRDEEDSLPTPATNNHMGRSGSDIFTTPATNRKSGLFSGVERRSLASPSITPTPGRFRDASKESSTPAADEFDITEEVMDLLKDEFVSEETSSAVRLILNRFSMKASGIAKGREITRAALKQKDTKIAELQQRISSLENEREMNKALIKRSKNDIRLYTVTTDS